MGDVVAVYLYSSVIDNLFGMHCISKMTWCFFPIYILCVKNCSEMSLCCCSARSCCRASLGVWLCENFRERSVFMQLWNGS